MDSSFWIDTINLGWSFICMEGFQAGQKKTKSSWFLTKFWSRRPNEVAKFHQNSVWNFHMSHQNLAYCKSRNFARILFSWMSLKDIFAAKEDSHWLTALNFVYQTGNNQCADYPACMCKHLLLSSYNKCPFTCGFNLSATIVWPYSLSHWRVGKAQKEPVYTLSYIFT